VRSPAVEGGSAHDKPATGGGEEDELLRSQLPAIGLPGLAKTKLVETMGIVLGLDARRILFTSHDELSAPPRLRLAPSTRNLCG
jgi:hypothetical protein